MTTYDVVTPTEFESFLNITYISIICFMVFLNGVWTLYSKRITNSGSI